MASFVHLHVHTEYSLLDGAARIGKLVAQAKALGMPALAITDHGVMYGVMDFYKQATAQGIKPVIGCEVYVAPRGREDRDPQKDNEQYHLVLLAKDLAGYRNLTTLVSQAYLEGFYYKPRVDHELLAAHAQGLIALSACLAGEVPRLLLAGQETQARERAALYRDIFGPDDFFLELQDHGLVEQQKVNRLLPDLAADLGLGLVATNDVHYVERTDSRIQDVLMCIQMGKTLEDTERLRFQGDEFYLKSYREMAALFGEFPAALANTTAIAEACNLEFTFGHSHLPRFTIPPDPDFGRYRQARQTAPWPQIPWGEPEQYLDFLCQKGLARRGLTDEPVYRERLAFELKTICRMGFAGYFLIVQDFCAFARERGILVGPGRGSAAGSLVSYVLGITDINPLTYNLLFERFLNPERVTMPDIDIDFDFERRGEVIDYVINKYGSDRVAQIITFGTMAARAAVRDVGRVLNLPLTEVDRVAKAIPADLGMTIDRAREISPELQNLCREPRINNLVETARAIEGMPRHASTHAAGVVIAPARLADFLPVQKSAEGGVVTQFPKDTVEEIGLLKMDLLGLKTLTLIRDVLDQVQQNYGEAPVLSRLSLDDEATYQLLSRAETLGVFQLESSGLRALLKELRPSVFDDIIALVALYRPGPLQSGMVEDFIRRKHGQTAVTYQHPALEPILKATYGVIVYQEQVMRIASELAGFSLGEADLLRRAMGKKKPEVIAGLQAQFVAGAQDRGIPAAVAGQVFALMEYFAGYGFNKSHSAAYALITYQTAYLKAHYPAEFMAALLTSVADTTDKVAQYIEECRRLGLPVLPPDVNESAMDFTVAGPKIRFGLAAVKNVGKAAIEAIILARETGGPFRSLLDFCTRVDGRQINRRAMESLIRAGAMVSLGGGRRPLLLVLDKCLELAARRQRDLASGQLNLFDVPAQGSSAGADLPLPDVAEFSSRELLAMEKELLGFYFSGHPLEEFRSVLERKTSMATGQISRRLDRQRLILGGIVHQLRPFTTKRGELMASFNLEDWAGAIKVLVFPRVYARWGSQLQDDLVVLVEGMLHCQDDHNEFFADQLTVVPGGKKTEPELPRLAVIKLPCASSNETVVGSLLRLLQAYPGDIPVQVCFLGDRRAFSLANGYWVSGSPELAVALREQFGLETVRTGPKVHYFSPGKT